MRLSLLMSSVAIVALAAPAFALPDRFEEGGSCVGATAACIQPQTHLDNGNRVDEKAPEIAAAEADAEVTEGTDVGVTADGRPIGALSAARTGDDDDIDDEVRSAVADVGSFAGEVGEEIGDTADDVGDAIADAFD